MLGGGDLDGDEYNLIPLDDFPQFRPGRPNVTPAEYTPAPRRVLSHPARTEDVIDFFLEYINSDVSSPRELPEFCTNRIKGRAWASLRPTGS